AEPSITDVVVRQRWPWSRLVDINYVVCCDSTQAVDVLVNAYDGDTALTLPWTSLTGDLHDVTRGQKRIVFDPTKTAYTNALLTRFRVDLQPSPAPLYMIVDLNKTVGEVGQIEYVYEAELVTNKWGSWVRNPVSNETTFITSSIWTGVTNGTTYKTGGKLVLRRIPAGAFIMGDDQQGSPNVTVSNAFYMSVFMLTEAQWQKIMKTGSNSDLPKYSVSYNDLRGSVGEGINWPGTGSTVKTNSFLGCLRNLTGLNGFDLPTDAEWEYACRAGTRTYYNDGLSGSSSAQMDVLGWWANNSGGTMHPVGQKVPNAWGLYDMHGNLYEWCLDWYDATKRARRGASWYNTYDLCRSAYRSGSEPSNMGLY
ncbi:MAG: formylglycine-generating enzyme family protein, partial [Kiritimatiellae bacterium]|nr:formylglycine-generating enzyme family protein [Kiritimatiellia bacterium]